MLHISQGYLTRIETGRQTPAHELIVGVGEVLGVSGSFLFSILNEENPLTGKAISGVKFGRKVKELRTAKGLTREAFASLVSISPSYLNNIEQGLGIPSAQIILALAKPLGIQSSVLFGLLDDEVDKGFIQVPANLREYDDIRNIKEYINAVSIIKAKKTELAAEQEKVRLLELELAYNRTKGDRNGEEVGVGRPGKGKAKRAEQGAKRRGTQRNKAKPDSWISSRGRGRGR